jgi:acetyl-CoA synthetase
VPLGYTNLHSNFRWHVPEFFNMAQACSVRWAAQATTAKRTAISVYTPGAKAQAHSYAQLQEQANRLSNALQAQGVQRGDRVAIVMPQRFETAVAYIAV